MGLWHLEAQAQRAHARHQLGSDASDRVVLTTRLGECWALEGGTNQKAIPKVVKVSCCSAGSSATEFPNRAFSYLKQDKPKICIEKGSLFQVSLRGKMSDSQPRPVERDLGPLRR